ncbi:MAG TPA: hydrogenase maturation nickel metallochaperone HypA [Cycloclasticus sp.]|jgi:hydrogenase nickel incorporation protein HypA/HybF|nr:hydrogenase maturation nickel metallochaperone HypA [Cycloclasticus sp.]HIL94115.1 hydrogenase maturation nickel metallochaperone HypA [Cycloclasticus sp.]
MHEMSLCEGILQVLETESKTQSFKRVKTVTLEIGELSSIEVEAMIFSYDVVTRNTLADGSKLCIVNTPGSAWCMKCSKEVNIKKRFDECPDCGSYQLQVTGGEEMKIKELEVE